ncbi:hypothetical protein AGLY_006942 [Aphis glycines]|uniref:Uncharacterized protein n=1 Tax=Aphis glycines TaxID=307491 RepID=A0A6G0TQI9_APHGL|nr:hypothetical protein AGLY_006942 [Aphis glycines]
MVVTSVYTNRTTCFVHSVLASYYFPSVSRNHHLIAIVVVVVTGGGGGYGSSGEKTFKGGTVDGSTLTHCPNTHFFLVSLVIRSKLILLYQQHLENAVSASSIVQLSILSKFQKTITNPNHMEIIYVISIYWIGNSLSWFLVDLFDKNYLISILLSRIREMHSIVRQSPMNHLRMCK